MSFPVLISDNQQTSSQKNPESDERKFPWKVFPHDVPSALASIEPTPSFSNAVCLPFSVRPSKLVFSGTAKFPYQGTFVDGEDVIFHSISAMEVYSDKSPEELRMEDYLGRPVDIAYANNIVPTNGEVKPIAATEPIGDDSMEYDSVMNEIEVASAMKQSFLSKMSEELSTDEWKEFTDFVKVSWGSIGDQLIRLFHLRLKWKSEGYLSQLSIGYHYSTPCTMSDIRKHGLLTKADRMHKGTAEKFIGAALGDGVYTGNDPLSFFEFRPSATEGMLVLRLMGMVRKSTIPRGYIPDDTIWGIWKQQQTGRPRDVINLLNSDQCAVLIEFDGTKVFHSCETLGKLLQLQTYFEELIDRVLVEEVPFKSVVTVKKEPKRTVLVKLLEIQKEFYLRGGSRKFSFSYVAPQTLRGASLETCFVSFKPANGEFENECSICLEFLGKDNLFQIKGCDHIFHKECATMIVNKYSKCPCCRYFFKQPQGESPSGNLSVLFDPTSTCNGYSPGTIKLGYAMACGVQKSYHGNRGICFDSAHRVAFIPDTLDGRKLLGRLVYAFLRGLIFQVGTSLSTGLSDQIIWGAIHHRTSTDTGAHGYPSTSYFEDCNKELDSCGVPESGSDALKNPLTVDMHRYLEWRNRFT